MISDCWAEINRLYNAAVEAEEKERAAFLEKACGEDSELRREVESLLRYDKQAQQFIDRPALQLTAEKLAAEPPSLVGRQLGPYQILGVLGAGGMGEVFTARDTRLNRTVAIKVLPKHFSERADLRLRFEREGGQGMGLRAQAVDHPRTHTREAGHEASTHHLILRGRVDDDVAVAGADDGHVVHTLGHVGEQIRDFNSRLSVLLKRAPSAEEAGILFQELRPDGPETLRQRLAFQLIEQRLRIERVHLAGTACLKKKNHRLSLGRQRRRLWIQGADDAGSVRLQHILLQEKRQRQAAKPCSRLGNELTPAPDETDMWIILIGEHIELRKRLDADCADRRR